MVVCAVPEALLFAHFLERRGDGLRVDIARNIEAAFLDQPPRPAHYLFDVLIRVWSQTLLEGNQMPRDRKGPLLRQTLIFRIDQAALAKHGLIFELSSQLLGQELIGEAFSGSPDALVVRVRDVPERPPLALVAASLED